MRSGSATCSPSHTTDFSSKWGGGGLNFSTWLISFSLSLSRSLSQPDARVAIGYVSDGLRTQQFAHTTSLLLRRSINDAPCPRQSSVQARLSDPHVVLSSRVQPCKLAIIPNRNAARSGTTHGNDLQSHLHQLHSHLRLVYRLREFGPVCSVSWQYVLLECLWAVLLAKSHSATSLDSDPMRLYDPRNRPW
jgi:hypothetical protein